MNYVGRWINELGEDAEYNIYPTVFLVKILNPPSTCFGDITSSFKFIEKVWCWSPYLRHIEIYSQVD